MNRRGFTLLEVLIAMAILSLSLVAILGVNGGGLRASHDARQLTVATLLARSKMVDVEMELRDEGCGDFDKSMEGSFEPEGYPSFHWRADVRKVDVDLGSAMGSLLQQYLSPDDEEKAAGDGGLGAAAGMLGGSTNVTEMAGAGLMENLTESVGEIIGKSIREITLEISWTEGRAKDSVSFTQYVAWCDLVEAKEDGLLDDTQNKKQDELLKPGSVQSPGDLRESMKK